MDDTSFIAQTAQFTSLQQMTQLSQQQQMLTGSSYIGRNVTVQNLDGTQVTGPVTALDNSGTTPALFINGTSYTLNSGEAHRARTRHRHHRLRFDRWRHGRHTGLGLSRTGGCPTTSNPIVPTSSPTKG